MDVGVHEAKTHLSRLLRRVALGEEVVIRNGVRPIAKLVPVDPGGDRAFGRDRGLVDVPDDFNEPLPEEVIRSFTSG